MSGGSLFPAAPTKSVCTHNLPLLAEERVALQRLVELTLGDVGKDLVLSFICCAVGDPEDGGGRKKDDKQG